MQAGRPYLRVIKRPDPIAQAIEVRELNARDSEFALLHDFGLSDFAPTQPSQLNELRLALDASIEERQSFAQVLGKSQRGAVGIDFVNDALRVAFVFLTMVGAQLLDNREIGLTSEGESTYAAMAARSEARRDLAASAVCVEEVGPGSLPRWTPQGELVCLQPLRSPIEQGSRP